MLTTEPEMLQPNAFCEHTTQQNVTAAGAYSAPPDSLAGFKGAALQCEGRGEGRKKKRKKRGKGEGEERGRRDAEREGRVG